MFKNSKITSISRFPDAGQDVHGKPAGSVMVVAFELDGQPFTALNGGPQFKFDEAVSFQVMCDTQADVDYYWNALTAGGQEGPCGWLKDKFGLSWQVVPSAIPKMMTDPDAKKSARVMNAFMKMKKLDVATIERAYEGADGMSAGSEIAAAHRRGHRRHHPRVRRAARAGMAGLDRCQNDWRNGSGRAASPVRCPSWICASAAPCAS